VATLCDITGDEEKSSRLAALHATYAKGDSGEELADTSLLFEVLTGFDITVREILDNFTRFFFYP